MEVFLASIVSYIESLSASNPKLVGILAIAYMVGLVLKIVREAVEKFVKESPSIEDDKKLAEIEQSPIAKAVFFLMDLLIRFKK